MTTPRSGGGKTTSGRRTDAATSPCHDGDTAFEFIFALASGTDLSPLRLPPASFEQ